MPKKLHTMVLTGGPSAGKTTAAKFIQNKFSREVEVSPEVATILLGGGFPAPDEKHPWTPEWQYNFQRAVLATQIAMEGIVMARARHMHKRLVVFDRGVADNAAYLPNGMNELCEISGLAAPEIHNRYESVLFLLTTALRHGQYQRSRNNAYRLEDVHQAIALDSRLRQAWRQHQNFHVLELQPSVEQLCEQVGEFVAGIVAK